MPSRDIIAFFADGDVLLESGRLPGLAEPEQRDVPDRVGADVFTGPTRRVAPDVFLQTVTGRGSARPPGEWIAVDALTDAQAAPDGIGSRVRAAVATAAREHSGQAPVPPHRPEWYTPGWLDEVDDWIDAALASTGRRRAGASVVTRMWSLSAIVRVATESGSVWFKATGGGFDTEPGVTAFLARHYGRILPTVLAIATRGAGSPSRTWMLMEKLRGVHEGQAPGAAILLAPAFADLQARTAGDLPALRSAGCPDRTMRSLLDGLQAILHESIELSRLSAGELAAARSAAPRMAELVSELWDCGLPDTLTHGDLHLGNVAYDGTDVRVFDWTDAAVSHPFLDAVLIARSAAGGNADPGDGIHLDRDVLDAYLTRWRAHRPRANVDRALQLAVPVNDLYQAISYEAIYRHQEDASRWELEGIVERFLRRLPDLVDGVG